MAPASGPCYLGRVSGSQPTTSRAALPVFAAVLVFFTAALWVSRPLVVSGDGVGYIKRLLSPEWDIVPGHLVYVPLLEWLRRTLLPEGGHAAAADLSVALSVLSGGLACALLFVLARRLTGNVGAGLVAAAGLAVSYGFYRASGDVEAYSTCVALMTGTALLLMPGPGRRVGWPAVVGAGVILGLCTLLHTSLVLFTPFVFFGVWSATGSWSKGLASVAVGGALSLASFVGVAMAVLGMDVPQTVGWVLTSDNGYAQRPEATL